MGLPYRPEGYPDCLADTNYLHGNLSLLKRRRCTNKRAGEVIVEIGSTLFVSLKTNEATSPGMPLASKCCKQPSARKWRSQAHRFVELNSASNLSDLELDSPAEEGVWPPTP
jgi:hypothetical protein